MLLGKAGHIAIGQRSKATQREMNDSVVVKTKKVFYTVGKLVSIELNSFRILFALYRRDLTFCMRVIVDTNR